MNRRGFLLGAGGILASFAAPAIVRADSLMRIVPRETVIVPLTGTEILRNQAAGFAEYMDRLAYSMLVGTQSGQMQVRTGSVIVPRAGFAPGDVVEIARLGPGEFMANFQVTECPEIEWKKPPSLQVICSDAVAMRELYGQGDVITVKLP